MHGQTTVTPDQFRAACGRFATGVAIATTRDRHGERWGLTVNSFSSVSLDPPLVLFSIDLSATSHDAFVAADGFAINILEAAQKSLSDRFSFVKDTDRFDGVNLVAGPPEGWDGGPPVLAGCLSTLICDLTQTVPGGDHTILIGMVRSVAVSRDPDARPLIYFRGGYAALDAK
jgi:flavin reductase (DIM6/NTAB) family NADH-FMN oxidoreductase RutF